MLQPFRVILVALVGLAGCVHPPPPIQREIPLGAVPQKVVESFRVHAPQAQVKRVVEWFFNRRVVCYYFDYSDSNSSIKTVAITPKGEVTACDQHSTPK